MRKRIYLAIPYTGMEEISFRVANSFAGGLIEQGYSVYSPISHSHPIAQQTELPNEYAFYREMDESMIELWAESVFVVCLKGWEKSVGVQAELEFAKKLGKEIMFIHIDPEVL